MDELLLIIGKFNFIGNLNYFTYYFDITKLTAAMTLITIVYQLFNDVPFRYLLHLVSAFREPSLTIWAPSPINALSSLRGTGL